MSATSAPSRRATHQSLSRSCFRRADVWPLRHADIPFPYPPNSFARNLFADPHLLNSAVSIFYKNMGRAPAFQSPSTISCAQCPLAHYCLKSFSCNTYRSPRKCCKQKTYSSAKPFRCNIYKKHGVGGQVMVNQTTDKGVCPERPSGVEGPAFSATPTKGVSTTRRAFFASPDSSGPPETEVRI